MSVTGPGIFQSDSAYDYLYVLIHNLKDELVSFFSPRMESGFISDDIDDFDGNIMPCMDILITLSKHYEVTVAINRSDMQHWKKMAVELFDTVADEFYASEEFIKERRSIIENTFNQLEERCYNGVLPE